MENFSKLGMSVSVWVYHLQNYAAYPEALHILILKWDTPSKYFFMVRSDRIWNWHFHSFSDPLPGWKNCQRSHMTWHVRIDFERPI